MTATASLVDVGVLRAAVRDKYAEIAADPAGSHHFHTGRPLAGLLGYSPTAATLPDEALEAFAGVGNPFSLRSLTPGERVVDVGCHAFLARKPDGTTG